MDRQTPIFLNDENPGAPRYHEASDLFALFGYLKAQGFGVFSIRESFQAVGERSDGTLQGFHMTLDEAYACVGHIATLGVAVVELPAFPANAPGQAYNRELLRRAVADGLSVSFAAHARCAEADIRAATETGFTRLHLYIGTSKIKQATLRTSIGQFAAKAADGIALARSLGATCVRISTEDAFRTTLEDYETFYTLLHRSLTDRGISIDGVGIPDTVGLSTVDDLGERIAVLRKAGIDFTFLECHVHNDIGNADRVYVDSLLLCKKLGITMLPDLSLLGIGERNGTIGLSSLLEAIYRRLILLYPRKMQQIRLAMRHELGALADGRPFVNGYRDADNYFYRLLAKIGFVFDRSPFSANTEFDGSGVHADTTLRAYDLAAERVGDTQAAIDEGNSAYAGALPPYDLPLRTPALACFGCGKANVRHWRERERLRLRPPFEIAANLRGQQDIDAPTPDQLALEHAVDELVAQIIRCTGIRRDGITHHEAMAIVRLCYSEPT